MHGALSPGPAPPVAASILWRNAEAAPKAAESFKLVPEDLLKFGVIDEIVPEPLGGAHRNPEGMANTLRSYILKHLDELEKLPIPKLIESRYEKFRRIGQFIEDPSQTSSIEADKKKRSGTSQEASG